MTFLRGISKAPIFVVAGVMLVVGLGAILLFGLNSDSAVDVVADGSPSADIDPAAADSDDQAESTPGDPEDQDQELAADNSGEVVRDDSDTPSALALVGNERADTDETGDQTNVDTTNGTNSSTTQGGVAGSPANSGASSPGSSTEVETPQSGSSEPRPGATTSPTTSPTTGSTTPETTPATATPVPAEGPWCQVEDRGSDALIRWDDEGKTAVLRMNNAWLHTPEDDAQSVVIDGAVDTNDDYVMRLWGGGTTTDIECSFVDATSNPTANPSTTTTTAPQPVAGPTLPAPIAVPGGHVQMGFSVDLWGTDREEYWSDLESVEGAGRLIAHEFKSFTKPINTDVYRWHLESGRDLLLTWNGTDAEDILNGSHDDWIREHAQELSSLPGTVMLRFWHEPDVQHKRAWIDNDPQQYIDSWNYVREIFVEEQALNIEWVWCPTAWNWDEQGALYYPGDANVDWICSDGYSGWDLDAPLTDIADAYTSFQTWADQHPNKPILIAEFGAGQRAAGDRADWVQGIPSWVSASSNIRAVVYFDIDMRPNGEIYDWRLRTEPDAWEAMMDVLTSAPFGR